MLESPLKKCAFCNSSEIDVITDNHRVIHWICIRCTEVMVSDRAMPSLSKYSQDLWYLSSFCRKRTVAGLPPKEILVDDIEVIIKNSKLERPKSVLEAHNRVLTYFAEGANLLGGWCNYDENFHLELLLLKDEAEYAIEALDKQGLLEIVSSEQGISKLRLLPEGWKRHDAIKYKQSDSNNVFVAMWYNAKTEGLRKALKAGIDAAGYDPIIVDERNFTGNIMDYVIARIRESRFVVADFTTAPEEKITLVGSDEPENAKIKNGSRGGVYYEAGFAKGLGLQVIHTCKRDNMSMNRLHFDVLQEKTIFWDDKDVEDSIVRSDSERLINESPKNLSEKLYDLILSIFGPGRKKISQSSNSPN